MGFANGVSSLDISNGPALAAEIGGAVPQPDAIATAGNATGTRLVNNLSTVVRHEFTGVHDSMMIDCSAAVSLALEIQAGTATPSSAAGSLTLQLTWYDSTQTMIVFQEAFEVNCGIDPVAIQTLIMDRCLASYCEITWGASAGVTSPNLTIAALPQTIPVDTRRIVEQSSAAPGDGLLGQDTFTLAAGASSGLVVFALTNGQVQIRCSAATAEGSFEFLWGYGGLQPFVVLAPAGQDTLISIPAANRPLTCKVTNKGSASSGFAVSAWTSNA